MLRRHGQAISLQALWVVFVLAGARPVAAQEFSGWAPVGPMPVDQAGAGRRGYVMSGDDSDVTSDGSNRLSIHTVAANNFYREQNNEFLITQRYETHTLALDYRRGFTLHGVPRFELGGQVQLHQRDAGMLNGLILGFETFWASVTGYRASKNELRTGGPMAPPLGTMIVRNGAPIYRQEGRGSGIGDLTVIAKMALLDLGPDSNAPRISARLGMNVAGNSQYTSGNYAGAGLSLDQRLTPFVALHGDVRATRVLDAVSVWNLPLRRWTYAFSVGPEFRLPKRSSFHLQLDGSTTPYWPTDTLAFDRAYGAITFGVGHRFGPAVAQLYFRENMNLPFKVRWNTDPDLSVGLKIRIH